MSRRLLGAVAMALFAATTLLFGAGTAKADLMQTVGPTALSGPTNSVTVTDTQTAGATSATLPYSSTNLAQFDTSNGVLTGATLGITSTQTRTGTLQNVTGPLPATGSNRAAHGTATSSVKLTAPGITNTWNTVAAVAGDCNYANQCSTTLSQTFSDSVTTNGTFAIPIANLGSYAGLGSVAIGREGTLSSTATIDTPKVTGAEYKYVVGWNGNVQIVYSYLAHANPSFGSPTDLNTFTIDFGTIAQGSGTQSSPSSINNLYTTLLAANTIGLDLVSIGGTGDTGTLYTDLSPFSNLGAGGSNIFDAFFDTSNVGTFVSHWLLSLADASVGGVGGLQYTLDLYLTGTVEAVAQSDEQSDVPEPTTIALFGTALLGFAVLLRRRRKTKA